MSHPRERIRQHFADVIPVAIEDDEDIFLRGIVDSLFAVHLVLFIESEFSLTVDPTELDINNFCSISALTQLVERKLMRREQNDS